ncbi:MAG: hypothetical protein Q4E75_04955 [bacterium]|nr:hypothetical protein [bacterium]
MKTSELNKLCISNLILIILNDKYDSQIRKFAEIELRSRIKNLGVTYDTLLHIDDKVINNRGIDINNYLISPNVNLQKLMETYFIYGRGINNEDKNLLFSEKHLCNDVGINESFFDKVCIEEIKNINGRLSKNDSQKEILKMCKEILLKRQQIEKDYKKNINSLDSYASEAMIQLSKDKMTWYFYNYNLSDEKKYEFLNSHIKTTASNFLNYHLFSNIDILDHFYGMSFIKKDSSRLNNQKKQILEQLKNGFEVNYETDSLKKVLYK